MATKKQNTATAESPEDEARRLAQAQVERIGAARAQAVEAGERARATVAAVDAARARGDLGADFLARSQAEQQGAAADEQTAYLGALLEVAEQLAASWELEVSASELPARHEALTAARATAVESIREALTAYRSAVAEWNTTVLAIVSEGRAVGLAGENVDPSLPVRVSERTAEVTAHGIEYSTISTSTEAIRQEAAA